MIEAKQQSPEARYWIFADGVPLCTVETVLTRKGTQRHVCTGPDWPATKARAEHIAEALRHYKEPHP